MVATGTPHPDPRNLDFDSSPMLSNLRSRLSRDVAATALLGALCAPSSSAQLAATVPGIPDRTDAAGADQISGLVGPGRTQILIDGSHLTAWRGRAIRQVVLRRDAGCDFALAGGLSDITLRMGLSGHPAVQARSRFADNLGLASQVVFQGTVRLPDSSAPQGRSVGFGVAEDELAVTLQTPFAYPGGTLCIDLEGAPRRRPVGTSFWAVDAVLDTLHGASPGTARPIGSSCSTAASRTADQLPLRSYYGSRHDLVPGSTVTFSADLGLQTAPILLVGVAAPGIDLHALGLAAPGCELLVAGDLALAATPRPQPAWGIAFATVRMQLPASQSLLGATFRTQMVELGDTLRLSNAVDHTVCHAMPTLGMATVAIDTPPGTATPTTGIVRTASAPVLQLRD